MMSGASRVGTGTNLFAAGRCGVREGDAVGSGIVESVVVGEHPRYGLTGESSFL